MYNHYVRDQNGNYVKVKLEEPPVTYIPAPSPSPNSVSSTAKPPEPGVSTQEAAPPHREDCSQQRPTGIQFANKMLGRFHLNDVDSGDLLLLALLFFLMQQKGDEELLIALGLLLIL